MKLQKKLAVLGGSALLAFSASASAQQIVDLFDVDQATLADNVVDPTPVGFTDGSEVYSSVNGSLTSILGGNRDLGVNLLTDPLGNGATIKVLGGAMSFNVGSGATAQGIMDWDGGDAVALTGNTDLTIDSTVGLGGFDLTEGGTNNFFQFTTLFSDLGFNFDFSIWDQFGDSVTAHLISTGVPLTLPNGVTSLLGFNTWDTCNAAGTAGVTCTDPVNGVDLTKITAIQIVVDPLGQTAAIDVSLASITTVPEPSSLVLLGAGLLSAGIASRRKNKKA